MHVLLRRRWRRRALLVAALAASAGAVSAEAASPPELSSLLERAVGEYAAALDTPEHDARLAGFRRAERLFAQVVDSGVENADLYANLGNAALQGERLGEAVLAYKRALRLDPDHERAKQNLEHARSLLPQWVPRPRTEGWLDSFFLWHATRSRAERSAWAALAFAAAALLVGAAILLRSAALRNASAVPALAWCALAASLALESSDAGATDAVVTVPEARAHAADSVHAQLRFAQPLPAGTELRVLEERTGWTRVSLANGREAWLSASSLTRVRAVGPGAFGQAD